MTVAIVNIHQFRLTYNEKWSSVKKTLSVTLQVSVLGQAQVSHDSTVHYTQLPYMDEYIHY